MEVLILPHFTLVIIFIKKKFSLIVKTYILIVIGLECFLILLNISIFMVCLSVNLAHLSFDAFVF